MSEPNIPLIDFDFDRPVNRHHTNSLKYDFAEKRGYPADVLPLWVADMDFPTAPTVLEALHRAVDHGIFGYSDALEEYYDAVVSWFERRFNWKTEKDWIVKTPGVVYALATAVRAYTEPGDAVLITPPVYYPFFMVVKDNGRNLVESELIYENGRYAFDFDDFERKVVENHVKMFVLCSPHNPVGRVWTVEELKHIGEICEKHNVLVVSDEIHCDFSWPDHPHTIFTQACPNLEDRSVICTAPSKTFNLAGLQASHIFIPSEDLRKKFKQALQVNGLIDLNSLGLVAAQAAYEHGEGWLSALKDYLKRNLAFIRGFLEERIPDIKLVEPEGTYFAWLDCSGLGLSKQELNDLVIHKAKLWLDAGHIFGEKSDQFQRVVLACQRETLLQALLQLEDAVAFYKKGSSGKG